MRLTSVLAACLAACLIQGAAFGQISNYSQDFESLDRTDPNALINDGWQLFAAGINGAPGFGDFGAGPFGAPNDINSPNITVISDTASGGTPPAGNQGLVVFTDTNSPLFNDPGDVDPRDLVLSIFQEQTISAADIGETVTFSWLADGNTAGPTGDALAEAFLLTLDPLNGFATTNDLNFDTTATADGALATNSLTLDLTDPALDGQLLQFGFRITASDFEGSAVDYDNVNFTVGAAVPEPGSLLLLAMGSLGAFARRRRA